MMVWEKIIINSNAIQRETDKALLIKMPNKSPLFKGYTFWLPKQFTKKSGKNNYITTLKCPDDFMIVLMKEHREFPMVFKMLKYEYEQAKNG